MNKEKLTKLKPIEIGYIINPGLPLIPFAMNISRAGCAAPHKHPRGQLIYASSGVMRVLSARTSWTVPPSQAVWLPPDIEHEVYFPGDVALCNLFIDPSVIHGFPEECCVLKISDLIKELILKTVRIGPEYKKNSTAWRLIHVLLDELKSAEKTALKLPSASDERVLRVMERLLKKPGDSREIDSWAEIACCSTRTMERLFVKETGLTFAAWRKQLRLMESVRMISEGQSITAVAFQLGYRSPSAFIEMFRNSLGASPTAWLKSNNS